VTEQPETEIEAANEGDSTPGDGNGPEVSDRGVLISHLHDQFWSDEYYHAAAYVRSWVTERGATWPAELFTALDTLGDLADDEQQIVRQTNAARRLIKSYFRKAQQLCVRGFLEADDLREHLTMPQRLKTLFQIIEPFEQARDPEYNREMFDFYDDLHRGELERPVR
jgi:hypothetical protein